MNSDQTAGTLYLKKVNIDSEIDYLTTNYRGYSVAEQGMVIGYCRAGDGIREVSLPALWQWMSGRES